MKLKLLILITMGILFVGCGEERTSSTSENINTSVIQSHTRQEEVRVVETTKVGTILKKVSIPLVNEDEVVSVTLIGEGAENFQVNLSGEISLKKSLLINKIQNSLEKIVKREEYNLQLLVKYKFKDDYKIDILIIILANDTTANTAIPNTGIPNAITSNTVTPNITTANGTTPVTNLSPTLKGVPKLTTYFYDTYHFQPIAQEGNGDRLIFTIENKPSWATFDSVTGLLKGIPSSIGTYSNIIISVTDGTERVSLAPFSIEVLPAIDIAHKYGKATQGTDSSYYYYLPASNAIDNNDSSFNHTRGGASGKNWLQIALPSPTKISKIVLQNGNGFPSRLTNAKVYLSNTPYGGSVDENSLIASLQATDNEQIFTFDIQKEGTYLLIKGEQRSEDDRHIHLKKVEVYGTTPPAPLFTETSYHKNIHRWYSKSEAILQTKAIDYQEDTLSYSIVESVPFRVDSNGTLYVSDRLTNDNYTFKVKASDGVNETLATVTLDINNTAKANNHLRTTDSTPSLWGYLPNTYQEGNELTILVNGDSYTATIENNGTWSIDANSRRLDAGDYNISVVVGSESAIIFENFFTIYGAIEKKSSITIEPSSTIEEIPVTVNSSTTAPLARDKKVRATSVYLSDNGGKLINDSYRKIKSLIAYYVDANGVTQFKKLIFDTPIEPHSQNLLSAFSNADKLKIYATANQFNEEIYFTSGSICSESTNDPYKLCTPTNRNETPYSSRAVQNPELSEQQVFEQVQATWHHIYNRVDGIRAIDAYINKEVYKEMNFADTYQGSDDYATGIGKEEFFKKSFFLAFLPNTDVNFLAIRYQYPAEGLGAQDGKFTSVTGEYGGRGMWASLWEGSLRLGLEADGSIRISPFEYIHHEVMHTLGMSHSSGFTYGWPHQATKYFIRKYYTQEGANSATYPLVNSPKYIFTLKGESENSAILTLHKQSNATSNNLTFEAFYGNGARADDFSFEKIDEAHVRVRFDATIFPRFFIRLYGEDSDEFMSKLLTPYIIYKNDVVEVEDGNKSYMIVPQNVLKALITKAKKIETINVDIFAPDKVCKMLTDTKGAIIEGADANKSVIVDAILNNSKLASTTKYYATHYGDNTHPWWLYSTYDEEGNISYNSSTYGSYGLVEEDGLGTICVRSD